MYRRGGRSGRDRSRDPSRPFQGRERDFDRNYRREERHSGHWEDFDRRGGGRDDRLHHPPPSLPPLPLASTPSGPPSGPAGHPPDQLASYPSSKPPRSRRDSRDSAARDSLPSLDTTRRHSGGTSSRKEFAEPSPRERGMIGDPQAGPPRRGSAWPKDKDDDRARSDTRRDSIDRNRLSRSPIESPRSFFPPPSPATSITATPITTTTNPTANIAGALPAPSALMHPIAAGGKDHTRCALIFQEASSAYIKYLEAQANLKTAEKERSDHSEHFNAFPAMKERYEGNAKIAKKEFASAQEVLKQKSAPLEDLCRELFKEQRNSEGIEFLNKVKKELGNSSLTQFVKSSNAAQGPSKDEFQQLRNELRDMKRKQDEEEKTRQNLAIEFCNYKNEQANKFRNQGTELVGLENMQKQLRTDIDKVKGDHHKTAEELKKAMSLLTAMKNNMDKLQETSHQVVKIGEDVAMTDAGNDTGTLGGRVDEVFKSLETLQKNVTQNQQKLEQTASKYSNTESEIKALQQKVSKLEVSGVTQLQEDRGASSLAHGEYATKGDILKLEEQIRCQDKILDDVQNGVESDTASIMEVVENLEKKTENHIQETTQRFQRLEQESSEKVINLVAMQEKFNGTHMAEIKEVDKKFTASFANFHNKFHAEVAEFTNRVGYVEGQLEGHILAISHVDQRMNTFTTKDFYERVVHELVRINPMLFSTTTQVSNVCNEMKAIKEIVRALDAQVKLAEQRLNQANLSPHPIQDGPSMGDGPSNGSLKSDRSSEGPLPSFTTVLTGLESLKKKVDKIEEDLSKHIDMYLKRMNDIKDWTASAAQRLQEGAENTNAIAEAIKDLRTYLGQRSGSPMQIPSGMERWRVVNANNQDAMQGLPDENGGG